MVETAAKAAPVNVAPFIKAARYGLLIFGVFAGKAKWQMLHQYQEAKREAYEKIRPTIESEKLERKIESETKGIMELGRILDIKFPKGYKMR